ncbi:hypothetical protein ACXR2U_07800 [Jatrophihabitans sp. YIM 134969]
MATGRPNRVAPDGSFHAVPERGGVFGNRGPLLGRDGRVARPFQVTRWIVCVLEFGGRRREQWQPGRYTELYFLDEATAFAAGHRPCAECRRPAFEAFRAAWQQAFGLDHLPSAGELDARLHADRLVDRDHRRTFTSRLAELPDGTVVEVDGGWWLVAGAHLRRWSFGGYLEARDRAGIDRPVTVVTPRATVEVLRAGYRAGLDGSAAEP